MKPFYQHDGITIYCGDCLDIMPNLEPGFAAIISDWPYGTTACAWDSIIPLKPLWTECKRLTQYAIMSFSVEPFTSTLVNSNIDQFRYKWIWRKNGVTRYLDANSRPLLDYEEIPVFYIEQPTYNPQKWKGRPTHSRGKTVGDINRAAAYSRHTVTASDTSGLKHPRLVLDSDIILDNAMGSGSTLVAAQKEGRRAIGIELSEENCKIAVGRLRQQSLWPLLEKTLDKPGEVW